MSDITINGVEFPDGDPLLINGVQAEVVTVNGIVVWNNFILPSNIVDFAASDDQLNQVTVTFTPATGLPLPTHDLYLDNALIASDIASGHVYNIAGPHAGAYKVKAVNVAGTTDSNEDAGYSAGLKIVFANAFVKVTPSTADFRIVGNGDIDLFISAGTTDASSPTETGAVIQTAYPGFTPGESEALTGPPEGRDGFSLKFVSNGIQVARRIGGVVTGFSPTLVYTAGAGFESAVRLSPQGAFTNTYVEIEGGPLGIRFRIDLGLAFGWSGWLDVSEIQTTP